MQFTEDAIILSSSKYGEGSAIICVFTQNRGIISGLVRGVSGKTNRGIYQIGNIVEATWRGRLPEHLGTISAGLLHCPIVYIMNDPLKLAALNSICAMIKVTIMEQDPAHNIYSLLKSFIYQLSQENNLWYKKYVFLELELLAQIGYGIDLTQCVATEATEDLIYVSPKSGQAVCAKAGAPYHDKMLKLPQFLIDNNSACTKVNIIEALYLSGYFLDKYYFMHHNIIQPQARDRFVNMLNQTGMEGYIVAES